MNAPGSVWKTKLLGETTVAAFSFIMDPKNFTRRSGSPKFLQDLLRCCVRCRARP